MPSQVFLTAIELDVFNSIGNESLKAWDISHRIGCSLRGTEMLLNAIAGLGLLKKDKNGKFTNSHLTLKYLVRSNPDFIGDAFRHSYLQFKHWTNLAECVRVGKPIRSKRDYKRFFLGMHYHGLKKAEFIAKKVRMDKTTRMLDIGAGPGTYSIAFLKKNKNLKCTLVDYPEAIEWAKKLGKSAGVLKRMDFIEGDFFNLDFGNNYDSALLSNIVHIYSAEKNLSLIKSVKKSLKPGGMMMIYDILLNENKCEPVYSALFSLNMLIHSEGGRSYTKREIIEWLLSCHFKKIRKINIPEGSSLLVCES